DLTAVATLVDSALDAVKGSNPKLNVSFNVSTNKFSIVNSQTGDAVLAHISYNDATDVGDAIGLSSEGSVVHDGANAETPLEAFQKAEAISDSFGSASFQQAVQLQDAVDLSQYVAAQNVKYMTLWTVTNSTDAQSWSDALIDIASTGLVL